MSCRGAGNATGWGHQPSAGESVSALCVRHVDGEEFPGIPFERYADDAICHCRSEEEAASATEGSGRRFADCRLVLHPEKTKIVYCKDTNRRGDYPVHSVRLSRLQVSSEEGEVAGRSLRNFVSASGQSEGAEGNSARRSDAGLSRPEATRHWTTWRGCTIRTSVAGSTTTVISTSRRCIRPSSDRRLSDPMGTPQVQADAQRPKARGTGWHGWSASSPDLFAHWSLLYGQRPNMGAV